MLPDGFDAMAIIQTGFGTERGTKREGKGEWMSSEVSRHRETQWADMYITLRMGKGQHQAQEQAQHSAAQHIKQGVFL
jgi:hypothetical protein